MAAAETAPATGAESVATEAVQTLSATHETLRPVSEALATPEAATAAPAQAANHGDDASAASANLGAGESHAAVVAMADTGADHGTAASGTASTADFGGDAGQLMDALLAAAQSANRGVTGGGEQSAQALAAVTEAFGDSHGAALVDAMVDHFAGAQIAVPAGGGHALAELFASQIGGSDSFGPQFNLDQMLSDMSAHAAAQV